MLGFMKQYNEILETIEAIAAHEPMNAKALTQALGITNGAVKIITL